MTSRPNAQDCRLRKGWHSNTGPGLGSETGAWDYNLGPHGPGPCDLELETLGRPATRRSLHFREIWRTQKAALLCPMSLAGSAC